MPAICPRSGVSLIFGFLHREAPGSRDRLSMRSLYDLVFTPLELRGTDKCPHAFGAPRPRVRPLSLRPRHHEFQGVCYMYACIKILIILLSVFLRHPDVVG